MHQFTPEQRAKGGRKSKRPKTPATYGKKLVQAFLEVSDPTEQVQLLKKYSTLPQGVELPQEIHFELYKMHIEANRRMTDQLVLEDEKQNLALERLARKEEISNRKLILSKQLDQMNVAQKEALYNQTLDKMRQELIEELTPVIRAELEAELGEDND